MRPVVLALTVCLLSGGAATAQTPRVCRAATVAEIGAATDRAARRSGLPVAWIAAVMAVESGGRPCAVSRAGAMGLMQLMPATYAHLRPALGLGPDPFQPRDNLWAGAAYLRRMIDRYGFDGGLAAYNAGPGRYDQFLRGRPLPPETTAYVAAVRRRLGLSRTDLAPPTLSPPNPPPTPALDPLTAARRSPLFPPRSTPDSIP
ncbi:hypothetical protein BZG35_08515 [Brevundimonas sp. LM2]|uniref:lytic transglycosylase domain-containing protein n=1 Tax=Brevundimonas sp. LM2 TaxID=1938605 RepID=UPI0009838C86|nr:lytic transglycosylase domain-containing protein [Brevundimonas sp. LM2]AQR61689.1 hypothetical protein BZG35_08515 [Brevundimonas sp. LM2]